MIANGARVEFGWHGQIFAGEVVDSITFNGKTRYGVRADHDGRTYDVWPDNHTIREV